MSEQNLIEHIGVITAINDNKVSVCIEKEDCHTCRLKGFCGVTDSERNTFVIEADPNSPDYKRGDRVKLKINLNLGYQALFKAYLMPFILVLFTIVFSLSIGISDKWAGLIALATIPPYYYFLGRHSKAHSKKFKLEIFPDE